MFWGGVSECFWVFWVFLCVSECFWVFLGDCNCFWVFLGVSVCFWVFLGDCVFLSVLGCFWVLIGVSECFWRCSDVCYRGSTHHHGLVPFLQRFRVAIRTVKTKRICGLVLVVLLRWRSTNSLPQSRWVTEGCPDAAPSTTCDGLLGVGVRVLRGSSDAVVHLLRHSPGIPNTMSTPSALDGNPSLRFYVPSGVCRWWLF